MMDIWKIKKEERLLKFAKTQVGEDFTTKEVRWAIEHHRCRVNGKTERFCSTRLKPGDEVELTLEKWNPLSQVILYEDDQIVAYDKPAAISTPDFVKRVGGFLVHRLDRDTTGVLLVAKDEKTQKRLENLFRQRKIEKEYLAVVQDVPNKLQGKIEIPLKRHKHAQGVTVVPSSDGMKAITHWELVSNKQKIAILRLFPKTGRTHQIRAHLKAIGHPILGDVVYGSREKGPFRPLLHAHRATLTLGKQIVIEAPVPDDLRRYGRFS